MVDKHKSALALLLPVIIALVSLFVSAFVGYSNNNTVIAERMKAVETQQANDRETLKRIEQKVDRVVDKVVGW